MLRVIQKYCHCLVCPLEGAETLWFAALAALSVLKIVLANFASAESRKRRVILILVFISVSKIKYLSGFSNDAHFWFADLVCLRIVEKGKRKVFSRIYMPYFYYYTEKKREDR